MHHEKEVKYSLANNGPIFKKIIKKNSLVETSESPTLSSGVATKRFSDWQGVETK